MNVPSFSVPREDPSVWLAVGPRAWRNYERLTILHHLSCHLAAQDRGPVHGRVLKWPRDVPPRHQIESLLISADHPQLWTDEALVRCWRQRVAHGWWMLKHGPELPIYQLVQEALHNGGASDRFRAEHGQGEDWA